MSRISRENRIMSALAQESALSAINLIERLSLPDCDYSIYTDLRRLERAGLVSSYRMPRSGSGESGCRYYNLTGNGRDAAKRGAGVYPSEGRIDAGEMVCAGPDGKARSAHPKYPEVRMAARPWADYGDEDPVVRQPSHVVIDEEFVRRLYSDRRPVRAAWLAYQLDIMEDSFVRASTVGSHLMNALGLTKVECIKLSEEMSPDDVLWRAPLPMIARPPPPPVSHMPPVRYRRDGEMRPSATPVPVPSEGAPIDARLTWGDITSTRIFWVATGVAATLFIAWCGALL